MNQILVRRKPELTNQDFIGICESLEVNPWNEENWRKLFGYYLNEHICTVVIKRTIRSGKAKSEYLAWVM
ncbi:MAG: hypothetical protein RMI79_03740 [Nitrososphaerota archaeon]|nr:hypothetical protein [Nitrososphaerota archaeon]